MSDPREEALRLADKLRAWKDLTTNMIGWELPEVGCVALNALTTKAADMIERLARTQPQGEPFAYMGEPFNIEIVDNAETSGMPKKLYWSDRVLVIEIDGLLTGSSPPAQAVPEGLVLAEAAAKICDDLAELREQGAGLIHGPGSRLRQAARMIRALSAASKPEVKDE